MCQEVCTLCSSVEVINYTGGFFLYSYHNAGFQISQIKPQSQPVTSTGSHVVPLFSPVSSPLCVLLLFHSQLNKTLCRWRKHQLHLAPFCLSFPSFALPDPLSPPTFILISSDSFSSASICSPVSDTDAVGKVENLFFLFSIFPKLGVLLRADQRELWQIYAARAAVVGKKKGTREWLACCLPAVLNFHEHCFTRRLKTYKKQSPQ